MVAEAKERLLDSTNIAEAVSEFLAKEINTATTTTVDAAVGAFNDKIK
jgi:hypothetical protein